MEIIYYGFIISVWIKKQNIFLQITFDGDLYIIVGVGYPSSIFPMRENTNCIGMSINYLV